MALKTVATEIYKKGLFAVLPVNLVRKALKVDGNQLCVKNTEYHLKQNIHIVGFGKAVLGMAKAVEEVLGDHIKRGLISVPINLQDSLMKSQFPEAKDMLLAPNSQITVREGAENNLPDVAAMKNAIEIENIVSNLGEEDILLVLVSGGGSALLPAPVKEITLTEKLQTTKMLTSQGSTIQELNTIRKKLSRLKGGRLVKMASCKTVISLILSDIVGDPIDLISSGPTVHDPSTYTDCIRILDHYSITDKVPKAVSEYLKKMATNEGTSSAAERASFCEVQNLIIGNNKIALKECQIAAESLGFPTITLSTRLDGDAGDVASSFAAFLYWMMHNEKPDVDFCFDKSLLEKAYTMMKANGKVCILSAGETTVNVKGKGKGGRNQELALATAKYLDSMKRATNAGTIPNDVSYCLLSAGTDGQDGPTPAAGAFCTNNLVTKAITQGLNIDSFLANNGSFDFFKEFDSGNNLFMTGLTGTNVMDIQILLIDSKHGNQFSNL